ncbi:MAG: protein kinase [Deltaproteobacteria bacterium]|nr:protein kinase [Deltaproteobacteria bacterium]NND29790.1 protein kinase [Myxococcales bacterium]MBT8480750.1 protein kinase [Deltaproteobacteria bacterium]NNK05701.1 protein kinase [Myxococcales bacterium]NNK42766.1 protein kinase [Myxococcales bacterium]
MDKAGFDTSLGEPDRKEFGPYTLVRRLGVGGMAETYEAIRKGPGDFTQRVCLKLVLPFFRDREDFLTLFKREARLAAKLRHSNVVGVIDFGETDGVTYIALELVDGADLATLLDAQPGTRIPPEHAALVGHDIAAALEHAHDPHRDGSADGPLDNAIIHRDLSPSNVLVSQRGEILLTDFGVAKAITGTARQQSAVKGKVPYMSPEQLRSETLDGRADLFALGVVLYESLAGHRPFQGEHDPGTIMQILNGDRRPLLEAAPDTPPGFAEVVEQLLEPDRDARPESATALLEVLDPYVPSPRERRELGKTVSTVRASLPAPAPLTPVSGSAPTDASGEPNREASGVARTGSSLPGGEVAAAAPSPQPRTPSRRVWLAGVLVLGIAAGLGLWANRAERAPSPERAPTTATPEPPPTPAADTVVEAESPAEPAAAVAKPAEPVAQEPKPGRLSVTVFPWGDVWIDGKPRGKAPVLRVALPPGRHKVSAGQGTPSKTRVVRLKAGQRRSIQFDLSK